MSFLNLVRSFWLVFSVLVFSVKTVFGCNKRSCELWVPKLKEGNAIRGTFDRQKTKQG